MVLIGHCGHLARSVSYDPSTSDPGYRQIAQGRIRLRKIKLVRELKSGKGAMSLTKSAGKVLETRISLSNVLVAEHQNRGMDARRHALEAERSGFEIAKQALPFALADNCRAIKEIDI
jgi:hypothetical protein